MKYLWRIFVLFFYLILFIHVGCGNRYDVNTARGRQAAIDDANLYLSGGNCQGALDAINPVYSSAYITDEVKVLRAAAEACFSGFVMVNLLTNLITVNNSYTALAKTMPNTIGDGKISALYRATDILTDNGSSLNAFQRSKTTNDFMVFLQLGIIGAIANGYGKADVNGNKNRNLVYLPAASGTLSNTDACALTAAHAMTTDSFQNSNLNSNTQASNAVISLNSGCASAGLGQCSSMNKNRSLCDGSNANSISANTLVGTVNSVW